MGGEAQHIRISLQSHVSWDADMKASDATVCRMHRRAANDRRIAKVHYTARLEYAISFRTRHGGSYVGIQPANTYRIVRACRARSEYAQQIRAISKARVGTRSGAIIVTRTRDKICRNSPLREFNTTYTQK